MAYVWQISVVRYKDKSVVSGVILTGKPVEQTSRPSGNFRHILTSYFKKPFVNKPIIISTDDNHKKGITNDHGGFSVDMPANINEEVKVFQAGQDAPLTIVQKYPVVFADSESKLAVISDVDDTIMVSHTASVWKRVNAILFIAPRNRKAVSFTLNIIKTIAAKNGRVFYVSKSESNLFGLISSIIEKRNIPIGNLNLTSYLRITQLLNPKKGKDYKERTIRSIIEFSPDKKFVLIGDDTQQDMAVYSRIAEKYQDRLIKIYIRKTRKNLVLNKKEILNKLQSHAVPFLYFSDNNLVENEVNYLNKYKNHPE